LFLTVLADIPTSTSADIVQLFNRLTPNDPYMGRTAPLTSKCCILYTGCAKIKKNNSGVKGLIYGVVLVNNQLDAQFFFLIFVYANALHVSSNRVLIIRRFNYVNATSGMYHSM
jgi:hypothetical protein